MFDIGFGEIILISVVALLVAGPERLPGMLRTVGVWFSRARRVVNNVKNEIEREIASEELKQSLAESKALIAELKQKASQATNFDDLAEEPAKGVESDSKKEQSSSTPDVPQSAGGSVEQEKNNDGRG